MDVPVRLLNAVLADPDEDAPRLAVAAWLDEHGDEGDREWAEFIRLQLGRNEDEDPTPRERELRKRLNPKLMNAIGIGRDAVCHRGFVEGLTLSVDEFVAQIWTLTRRTPVTRVRVFRASGSASRVVDILQRPELGRLRDLVIQNGGLDLRDLRLLTECASLSNLEALTLDLADLGATGAELLARSPVLKNLRVLHLPYSGLGDEGVACLAASELLVPVEDLSLLGNHITATGIETLAGSLSSKRLRRLDLWGNIIGSQGVEALMTSFRFHELDSLILPFCDVDHEAISDWPSIVRPSNLRWLDMRGSNGNPKKLEDAGLAVIARTPWTENLRVLHLTWNDIGVAGVEALANTENSRHLHTLGLGHNPIGDGGAFALARSSYLGGLRSLRIRDCKIGSKGAKELATSLTAQVDLLDMRDNPIRAAGIRALRERFGDVLKLKEKP